MDSNLGPVVQSAILRNELVRLRRASGFTQYDVARELGWLPTKLIRIEGGRSLISVADLDALLDKYGVPAQAERERLRALNQGAWGVGWWNAYKNEIDAPYLDYVGYEAGAVFIRQYPGTVVPGLLQTPEYADAITEPAVKDEGPARSVVSLRLQRQLELGRREGPPRRYFILDEGVIRRRVGINRDLSIMPSQLRSIADVAESDGNTTIRVIPFDADAHIGLTGPFTLLEFDGGLPDLLYIDTGQGERARLSSSDPEVAEHADRFEQLLEYALPESESPQFLRAAADEMAAAARRKSSADNKTSATPEPPA